MTNYIYYVANIHAFRDNIDVDIVGANLYQKYIKAYHHGSPDIDDNSTIPYTIPSCRRPPPATGNITNLTLKVLVMTVDALAHF